MSNRAPSQEIQGRSGVREFLSYNDNDPTHKMVILTNYKSEPFNPLFNDRVIKWNFGDCLIGCYRGVQLNEL
jgi:hypothetical protein